MKIVLMAETKEEKTSLKSIDKLSCWKKTVRFFFTHSIILFLFRNYFFFKYCRLWIHIQIIQIFCKNVLFINNIFSCYVLSELYRKSVCFSLHFSIAKKQSFCIKVKTKMPSEFFFFYFHCYPNAKCFIYYFPVD